MTATGYNFINHQLATNPFLRQHDDVLIDDRAYTARDNGVTVEQALAKAVQCERVRLAIGSGDWMRQGGGAVSEQQHRQLWLNYLTALRTAEIG